MNRQKAQQKPSDAKPHMFNWPGQTWRRLILGGLALMTLLVGLRLLRPADQTSSESANKSGDSRGQDTQRLPYDEPAAVLPQTANAVRRTSQLMQGVRASGDTWPTEAHSEAATRQLKQLGKLAPRAGQVEKLQSLVAADFACEPLRPAVLETVYETRLVKVRRWQRRRRIKSRNGAAGLAQSLRDLFVGVEHDGRVALKIVRIVQTKAGFDTVVRAEGGGQTATGGMQWTATWDCRWVAGDAKPRLKGIVVADYEEVVSTRREGPWLTDATSAILGDANGYRDQLLFGMDYWVNKLEHRLYPNRLGHHGLALGDVNNDGLLDLYVCQPGGLPNRLYVHQPDGTASDHSGVAGVDILDDTTSALFIDLDNDGDQDLALLTVSGGFIFSNDGTGKFELRATMPDCRNSFSITAADYDQDGLLDLYVGRYWPEESVRGAIPLPVPYYDALNGGSNVLLKNAGDWNFTDVTTAVGLDIDNTRYTMAAAWEDYDNDGDQDLYVANDFGRNCLYRNDGGRFVNIASQAGVEDTAAGMSVSWSDYNHDGNMDVYIGNMFSSAGSRITYQRQFEERFDEVARTKLQRLARGNSLFSNLGGDRFQDVSVSAAVTMGRWAWGSVFIDLNNDSWDDLVVANGHVTTEDTGDL